MQFNLTNLSDNDLRQLAYMKASKDVNDKKNRRLSNALFYSIPLASGLRSAVKDVNVYPKDLFELQQKGFSNNTIQSAVNDVAREGKLILDPSRIRSIRLARFGTATLAMGAGLALFDGVYSISNFVKNHSQKVNNFMEDHPVVSSLATFTAGLASLYLLSSGVVKLLNKNAGKLFDAYGVLKTPVKLDKFLAENKIINGASKLVKKVPSSVKGIMKGAVSWAPLALAFAYIGHDFKHVSDKNSAYINNYIDLKNEQERCLDYDYC